MFKQAIDFQLGNGYKVSPEEIDRQNRLAVRYFAIAGLPVSFANVMVQAIVQHIPILTFTSLLLPIYFVLLFLFERFLLPRQCKNSTMIVYLAEAPVMLISILLGTVWDPTHQALTFPMFMAVIPIFILDIPLRTGLVGVGWNVLFLVLVFATKDPSVQYADLAHCIEFYLLSMAVSDIVQRLRFEVVYNLDRANYHLEHDVLTDTRNRLSLEWHASSYLDQPLYVCMGIVDHLTLISDFYGKECADQAIGSFAHALKEQFGVSDVYRYAGDEFLAVARGADEGRGLVLIEECRRVMSEARFEDMGTGVSVSFGYVTGAARSTSEFSQMVQLADIYCHEVRREGEGSQTGGAFDEEALHDGISRANISTHARSYEVNQLTGLPALPYFVAHTAETLRHIAKMERNPVIGYLKITRFREFNEEYGYTKGDETIRAVADLLNENFPNRHITYVSGSKFAVMCYLDEVDTCMGNVCDQFDDLVQDERFRIKVGFAAYHDGDAVIPLIDKARMALKSIQTDSNAAWRLYDAGLDEQMRLERYLVSHLDQAIEQGWLQVYYQPIMWSSGKSIANFEALSRWVDPTYGFLPPYKFIGVLEREHLIYKLSLYVIKRALDDIKRMRDLGLPLIPVSVNLSRNDFLDCDMVEAVSEVVAASGLDPQVLSIEITESAFAHSQEMLSHEVDRFHERGFSVWMDDFGSEYSTLNLLENLDFDLVKLDMRFMRNFGGAGKNTIIVSSIIEMCARLGMQTLVEGVEEDEQAKALQQMGSDKLQGFLFSRPLPFDEVVSMVTEKGWAGSAV